VLQTFVLSSLLEQSEADKDAAEAETSSSSILHGMEKVGIIITGIPIMIIRNLRKVKMTVTQLGWRKYDTCCILFGLAAIYAGLGDVSHLLQCSGSHRLGLSILCQHKFAYSVHHGIGHNLA
jgi:hypothetical protein